MRFLIITGPPFSGKGTQCTFIQKEINCTHVSTGDLCRNEKAKGSDLGRQIADYDTKGDLVPDSIMNTLLAQFLDSHSQENAVILDGYPRTKKQVNDLIGILTERNIEVELVLNIQVPETELLKRAQERAKTSKRLDDKDPEVHIKRIRLFEQETKPAIDYMKSKFQVVDIDGMGSIGVTSEIIRSHIQ